MRTQSVNFNPPLTFKRVQSKRDCPEWGCTPCSHGASPHLSNRRRTPRHLNPDRQLSRVRRIPGGSPPARGLEGDGAVPPATPTRSLVQAQARRADQCVCMNPTSWRLEPAHWHLPGASQRRVEPHCASHCGAPCGTFESRQFSDRTSLTGRRVRLRTSSRAWPVSRSTAHPCRNSMRFAFSSVMC